MFKRTVIILALVLVVAGMVMVPTQDASAGIPSFFYYFGNGYFETGDLTYWAWAGDVGVLDENVITGNWSAFLTTLPDGGGDEDFVISQISENPAVMDMCSFLYSGYVFPAYDKGEIEVSFNVRYKTDEWPFPESPLDYYSPYEDPFTAELVTWQGTVEIVTIKVDGITPGPGTWVRTFDPATGRYTYYRPPVRPPFMCSEEPPQEEALQPQDNGLFICETPTMEVRQKHVYTGCEPVAIKFTICDANDPDVGSAAFIDDVMLVPHYRRARYALPCPPPPPPPNGG